MYFSSVGGNIFKAQVQNHYEKVRCDLHLREISKRHIHSLTNINKSMREARDTLKEIRANSGYCTGVPGKGMANKTNAWKEQEWSRTMSQPNDETLQAMRKMSIKSKILDSGEQSKMTVDGFTHRSLSPEKNELNIVECMENSMSGAGGENPMNGDRSDIVPDGRLLRDGILTLPDSRNVSGRVIRGTSRQGMDSTVKESQGRSDNSNFRNPDMAPATDTEKSLESTTSRTDDPLQSAIGSSKPGKSRTNTENDGLLAYRSLTAPEKASRLKSQVKSAKTTKSEYSKSSGSTYLSASDVKKVKIHVSISRTERKRLLQELISGCTVPCDRSVLERQRQRRLHHKIQTFFELLFEQDDKCDKDDESDIFDDE